MIMLPAQLFSIKIIKENCSRVAALSLHIRKQSLKNAFKQGIIIVKTIRLQHLLYMVKVVTLSKKENLREAPIPFMKFLSPRSSFNINNNETFIKEKEIFSTTYIYPTGRKRSSQLYFAQFANAKFAKNVYPLSI